VRKQPLARAADDEHRQDDTARWALDDARPESLARRVVTSLLADAGASPGQRDDAELAIQELVVNARMYAPGPYELRVAVTGNAVTFAVADGGGDHAAVARLLADPTAKAPFCSERGRGLRIVAALFPGDCGARSAHAAGLAGAGKHVWFRVAPIKA
jgi:anti-sigma regulatory factor (Ser/Thr protein kinase)